MFAKIISTTSSPNGVGHFIDLLVEVTDGRIYKIRYMHGAIKTLVVENANGTQSCITVSCRGAAGHILARELRRKGVARKPKTDGVERLAHIIHIALERELDSILKDRAMTAEFQSEVSSGNAFA